MDVDVEAMLDAPYQEKKEEPPTTEDPHSKSHDEHAHSSRSDSRHRSSHSRHREDRDRRYSSRSRDKGYRRSSRSLSRDRRHYRSSGRSRSRDYRSSSRRSSQSPSRRHGKRSPSSSSRRYRRSRSPYDRHGDRDRSARNSRRGGRSQSPPVPEEERDRRTVFVTQLAARLRKHELDEFFAQAGRIREAKLIEDRITRKSKGVGYVEYYEEASVQNALALSGQKLLGIPVLVQLSEAEKNRLALQAKGNATGMNEPGYQRLYVGSLHFNLTDDDVRQIFEPFGSLDFVNVHKDPSTGRSKGFGFIQYKKAEDAKQALEKMNGFELAGRNLKVGLVTEKGGINTVSNFNLDDEESEGLALNSLSRADLMAKLAARDPDSEPAPHSTPTFTPVEHVARIKPSIPVNATRYIILNNMFNPAEETEPNWVSDLEVDIKQECERFGLVEYIRVNADSMGEVLLKFDNIESAKKTSQELNGRWFGGKQITASYVSEAMFNANSV